MQVVDVIVRPPCDLYDAVCVSLRHTTIYYDVLQCDYDIRVIYYATMYFV